MSHFAKINPETNIVEIVLVGRQQDDGREEELSAHTGDIYKQTSYNTWGGAHLLGGTPLRKNYAGIGYVYDEARDAFYAPQPYPSWTLDEDTCWWQPPVPKPTDENSYEWDEETLSWVIVLTDNSDPA